MNCPRCGAKNADKNTYCRYCGFRMQEEAPLPQTPPPERKKTDSAPAESPVAETVEQVTPQLMPTPKTKIPFFTRLAYRVLSSKERYRNLFIMLVIAAVSLAAIVMLAVALPSELTLAMQKSESAMQEAFQEWRMVWSAVLLMLGFAGVLAGCAVTGYKMLKIRRVFREKGREIVPLPPPKDFPAK